MLLLLLFGKICGILTLYVNPHFKEILMKLKLSKISALHYFKLVYRSALLIVALGVSPIYIIPAALIAGFLYGKLTAK